MLNSQLEHLNLTLLKSQKGRFYISLEPLDLEIDNLEVGDIIFFRELNFIVRDRFRQIAQLELTKVNNLEGFLVKSLFEESIKEPHTDIRVAKVQKEKIELNNWIEFNWRVSKSLFIFSKNRAIGKGELVELKDGFGVRVKEIYE